jgi:ABC-type multidrug transport system fused ATPase/permease subunit
MRLFLVMLDIVGVALLGVSVSIATGTVIDRTSLTWKILLFSGLASTNFVFLLLGLIATGFFIGKGLISLGLNSLLARKLADIEVNEATKSFESVLYAPLEALDSLSEKEISDALVLGSPAAYVTMLFSVSVVFGEGALILGIAIVLAWANMGLFAVLSVLFLLTGLALHRWVGQRSEVTGVSIRKHSIDATQIIGDVLGNLRQIRASNKIKNSLDEFTRIKKLAAISKSESFKIATTPRYVIEIALIIGLGLLLGFRWLAPGVLTVATVTIFIAGAFRIVAAMLPFQGSLNALLENTSALAALERLPANGRSASLTRGITSNFKPGPIAVELVGVSYAYPDSDRKVISDLSLRVMSGERVAIVGRSGTGKSTLTDLIVGFRRPQQGTVALFGMSPGEYFEKFGMTVGYVSQNATLIAGSLRQNVTLSFHEKDDTIDAKVTSALVKAGLKELLGSGELSLETRLGQGGRLLSGGQVQRISLARAFFLGSPLIILDESTSAVDAETESIVRKALKGLGQQVTILAIAHENKILQDFERVISLKA